jgi:serine phosphatase RsbU (regulator of sigma subunit)
MARAEGRVSPPRRRRGPVAALAQILWRSALFAVPFALFFWVQNANGARALLWFYIVSFVFAAVNGLFIWATEQFVLPRFAPPDEPGGAAAALRATGFYGAAALLGSYSAALLMRATFVPSLLSTPRAVVVFSSYVLLFTALALGLALAATFYRRVEERARADQELRLARRIQSSFLPTEFPELPGYDVHAVNVASREVSGDFYDVVPAGDGRLLLAIADVSGKGVAAALLTSMLQASLRTQAVGAASVAGILENINRLLLQQLAVGRFATFFLARLETASGRLTYCNAGHNPPLLRRAAGTIELLEVGGTVVGILADRCWEEGAVELRAGDRLVFYTDGITEAAGPGGEMFGDDRLRDLVGALPPALPSRDVAARLLEQVDRFTGGSEPDDDRTLLLVRVRAEAAA